VVDLGWQRAFEHPIVLANGRELITLRDAATFITKLPKREHDAPELQAAMEALMLVAERGGPDHARPHRHHARAKRGEAGILQKRSAGRLRRNIR
jgi:hypothetical protein